MSFLRLTTIHPMLVHFTIGALPVLVVAYLVAAVRRDDRWTFVGDVATVTTALITIVTFLFGLVSNFALDWPGGLATWRWGHLALGAFSTVLLCAFAAFRLVRRKHLHSIAGFETVGTSAFIALCIFATGWIGGEVLVYRSGMAVAAAGNGALAPPTSNAAPNPHDVGGAMHDVRSSWAEADATMASMIVTEPDDASFAQVADDAARIETVAQWMQGEGTKHVHKDADVFADLSRKLEASATDLEHAARAKDIRRSTDALGAIGSSCAECHARMRWRRPAQETARL
ncbi:MAG TPA: DUF2231 domain-containing protein [Polyangiaceae bacterium]|jgi:uncharacterized membrane protein